MSAYCCVFTSGRTTFLDAAPALIRAATAAARKHPSIVQPATPSRPFLASSTSATPATHTSAPAAVDRAAVGPNRRVPPRQPAMLQR